jgi:hypothetical protein
MEASGEFERALVGQASDAVFEPDIESESRSGRDYVRVTVLMTVIAVDVAEALISAWRVFCKAAGDGWDLASATAQVRPGGALAASWV